MKEFKKGDYIVRRWPSGNLTMGMATYVIFKGVSSSVLYFRSLESYPYEGGVQSGGIYGVLVVPSNAHRVATELEISIFKERGFLQMTENNIKSLRRNILIDKIFGNPAQSINQLISEYK
jgi:hypothetical protein